MEHTNSSLYPWAFTNAINFKTFTIRCFHTKINMEAVGWESGGNRSFRIKPFCYWRGNCPFSEQTRYTTFRRLLLSPS